MEHCWEVYIIPQLDAVTLWLLAATSTQHRQWVEAHVQRELRAGQWFTTGRPYAHTQYLARHGTLFWRLFHYFGRDAADVRPGAFLRSWAVSFMRAPSFPVLTYAGPALVDATYAHFPRDTTVSMLRWCRMEAQAMPPVEVTRTLEYLLEHGGLPPRDECLTLFGTSLRHHLRVVEAEPEKQRRGAPWVAFWLALMTGHVVVADTFWFAILTTDTAHDDPAHALHAAILSDHIPMVDRVVTTYYYRGPTMVTADAFYAALHVSDEMAEYVLKTHLPKFLPRFDAYLSGPMQAPSPAALSRLRRLCGSRYDRAGILSYTLEYVKRYPLSLYNQTVLQWAVDEHILREEDIPTVVLPALAPLAFTYSDEARIHAFTDEELEEKMQRCDCSGHTLARLVRQVSGFANVRFTREMIAAAQRVRRMHPLLREGVRDPNREEADVEA
jgi:hypothetical protein